MENQKQKDPTRRSFLEKSGAVAAGSALAGLNIPAVHAAEDNTIRLALIGCGGRGSGAVKNAFTVASPEGGPVQLHAMADLREDKMELSHKVLSKQFESQIDVPPERQFLGFDAYKKAIDCLRPGDVAMITGYAGWRPVQLEYAVEKGINVFMEKSFATDPPGARRIIAAGEKAKEKNLKIAAGLMCRHSPNRKMLIERLRNGEIGDLQLIRAYRMQPVGPLREKPEDYDELMWQIRNFTKFFWVSGGLFAEMTIHQIDEICWLKGELPIQAHGIGGRAPNSEDRAQNLDSYSIEYTFADGTKATVGVRYRRKTHSEFATYVHGTERAAQFSGQTHAGTVQIFNDHRTDEKNVKWKAPDEELTPWEEEWKALLDAIRFDRPHNEAKRAAESNLADMMGRAAVHSGNIVTLDDVMSSEFQWCPGQDEMDYDTTPPVAVDAEGRYPAPSTGDWVEV
jgi:predicted dehydrogenase